MSAPIALARNVALSTTLLAISTLVHAQNSPTATGDDALTWKGITLYGVVDVGLEYITHSAPGNDYLTFTADPLVQKYANKSVTGLVSNPLSASRVGLNGIEPITGDWSAVARLETYFNPTSGQISDTLHSISQNNGVALNKVSSYADSSFDGELFETAYVGVSSRTWGTLTFGRHVSLLSDGVIKYDIIEDGIDAASAFSLLGNSRAAGAGGDTENARLDHSIKYVVRSSSGMHLGLMYQLSNADGDANTALQAQVGFDGRGLSVDAYYTKKYDGISAAPLTAAQVAGLPPGADLQKSLAGPVSDNTAFAIMASYEIGPFKVSGGYDHLQYTNPSTPLAVGTIDISGYVLQAVNNTAFINDKVLEVFWVGGKYYVTKQLYITASYYGYHQNAYGTGSAAGCSNNTAATCSGTENAFGFLADYRFNKHFDTYAGGLWSDVAGGLSNGFLNTSTLGVTTGLRFMF